MVVCPGDECLREERRCRCEGCLRSERIDLYLVREWGLGRRSVRGDVSRVGRERAIVHVEAGWRKISVRCRGWAMVVCPLG